MTSLLPRLTVPKRFTVGKKDLARLHARKEDNGGETKQRFYPSKALFRRPRYIGTSPFQLP